VPASPTPPSNRRLAAMLRRIRRHLHGARLPIVTLIAETERDPFKVLVSTILSARTKDEATAAATRRLFDAASTPEEIGALPVAELERLIFPVGFYRTKAKNLRLAMGVLLDRFDGEVPRTVEELVELPGVGRKTANLVVTEGFRRPGICVDTHVHRITNLWGYVDTRNPLETEMALRAKLPRSQWTGLNKTLVSFGQKLCVPVSPWCSRCPVEEWCPKLGVERSR
jgi:endonuclease-3